MLEEKLDDVITEVEQQIKLVKIKLKNDKKDLKQLIKMLKDNDYLDNERVQKDILRLTNEVSELDIRLYNLKKIHYRLRVCLTILNNESE